MIYFEKAFDKADHGILLHKIKDLGIRGKMGEWIHNFITGRKQKVMLNGVLSSSSKVNSGVPQGSVLGPLLFLIMIGDIDKDIKYSRVTSFADDTRISTPLTLIDGENKPNEDIEAVCNWAKENNMEFNADKFEILRYNPSGNPRPRTYSIEGSEIKEKVVVKDLGIWMSNDLSFVYHIEQTVNKGRVMSGWLLRTFKTRDPEHLLPLWKTLVIPKLEYQCQVWSPNYTKDIVLLEQVQRVFTRKIYNMIGLNYWERLKSLKLFSLQRRRERYFIIYVWKIIENLAPNPREAEDGGIKVRYHIRHGRKCYRTGINAPTAFLRKLQNQSFLIHGPKVFNSVPKNIRNITQCSVEVFKRKLDGWLNSLPDEPPTSGSERTRAESNSIPHQVQFLETERRRAVLQDDRGRNNLM